MLLAFTLPKADVEELIRELDPASPLKHRALPVPSAGKGKPSIRPFAHLGLKEPDALADVTEGSVCLPCKGELNWLNIAVHPLDARNSQVYFDAAL
jgi:hypothetical protein